MIFTNVFEIPTVFFFKGIIYEVTGSRTVKLVPNIDAEYSNSIIIPSEVIYNNEIYTVTKIGKNTFSNSGNSTLDDIFTTIRDDAFNNYYLLFIVTIPKFVAFILDTTLNNCFHLIELAFNTKESLKTIPNMYECENVPSVKKAAHELAFMWNDFSTIKDNTTICIDDIATKTNVTIYPSQIQNELFILLNSTVKTRIQLSDTNGNVLIQKNVNTNVNSIDTSDLARGIYFVKVNSTEGTITKRVVKK